MDTTQLKELEPVAIDDFYKRYRDQLQRAYQANRNLLDEQRLQAQASIMGEANQQGMMYSNFPARSKMQYDVNTYNPAVQNLYTGYQSGLDSLRNKGVGLANQIQSYKEGIQDYNYYQSILKNSANQASDGNSSTTIQAIIDAINKAG